MGQSELIPHLFRTEYSKITAVLCNFFGFNHLEIAEDIASEIFVLALETWSYKGLPENPTAWLYSVARNKARNWTKRNQVFAEKVAPHISFQLSKNSEMEIDLSDKNISDSQLQMLFAICNPSISKEAQISLALRILCGFGIEEIANALLTNRETINKRLFRAKETLRKQNIRLEIPGGVEIANRLETVLITLYLLFSEGYYSENHDEQLREDLCLEAMRLTYLLLENEQTNRPEVNALFALMCFHASRFKARKSANGEILLYDHQDESLWNQELISKGASYLNKAAEGECISKYHLEAGIAWWHTNKADTQEKWENILQLYNRLLQVEYSPIAAMNRTFAYSKVHGKKRAIEEAEKLQLTSNHFYFTLLGELYMGIDNKRAKTNFQKAFELAKTKTERQVIQAKIDKL